MQTSVLLVLLSLCLLNGCKPLSEEEKRWEVLCNKAESGDPVAQENLAFAYHYSKKIKNISEAVKWYKKSAEQGNAEAQFSLGKMYIAGEGVPRDYVESARLLGLSVAQGNSASMYYLAWLYAKGKGVGRDYELAAKLFQQANNSLRKDHLFEDLWSREDETLWYLEAAGQGVIYAQYVSAQRLEGGQDFKGAIEWYSKAASKGHPPSLLRLGDMYYKGVPGIPREYSQAIKWWSLLGEQGDEVIQTRLGYMHKLGEGASPSLKQAQAWFQKAAMVGHASAMVGLGELWSDLGADPANAKIISYAWYNLAVSYAEDFDVKDKGFSGRDKVQHTMGPAEINEAQRMSGELGKEIEARRKASGRPRIIPAGSGVSR